MLTFILNWYGPYTSEDIENDKEYGNGVYLITGKQSYERKNRGLGDHENENKSY